MLKFPLSLLPSSAMRPYAIFTLLVALLADSKGNDEGDNGITVFKCCDEYELLSGDGKSCVGVDLPSNVTKKRKSWAPGFKVYFYPLNENMLRHWLPPGLPLHRVRAVAPRDVRGVIVPVNESCEWNKYTCVGANVLRTQVVFFSGGLSVVRPKPGGGLRTAAYCVDAALPPLGPFAMRVRTECTATECDRKCCEIGQVMVNKGGNWMCEENDKDDWTSVNASFARDGDPEYPTLNHVNCPRMHLADPQDFSPLSSLHKTRREHFFGTWQPCTAYHSAVQKGVFYCEYPRIARGIYWILRPLCVLSALLLAMALLGIACDGSMRWKMHGWCLASHAFCLFGFNVGQIAYYVQVRDASDLMAMSRPTPDVIKACKHFALMMYFLLMAAWFWLTAVCMNMALGFRLQAATRSRSVKKRFIVFSVLAWGLPALMTITCAFLFTPRDILRSITSVTWEPSLAEARVCFNEPTGVFQDVVDNDIRIKIFSPKHGTALFYYGPVLSLMICNVTSLFIALRKIKRLRRGNSVLRREEDLRHRRAQGNPPSAANIESATGGTSGSGNGGSSRREVDSKTIKMYLKMILMTGALEIVSEAIIWATTQLALKYFENNAFNKLGFAINLFDFHLPYRSSGHVTDFLRAACVAWLAAPEGGYLGPILRRLRGEKK